MQITKRKKGQNQGKTAVFTDYRINIKFGIDTLDLLCAFVKSENSYIKNSHIISLRNLIELINMESYLSDGEKLARFSYIRKGIEARLEKGLRQSKFIESYIKQGGLDNISFTVNEISTNEVEYILNMISSILSWAFIDKEVDKTMDICTRFKAADYSDRSAIVEEYIQNISAQNAKFRQLKNQTKSEKVFTLEDEKMESVFSDVYDDATNPNRFLKSGMVGLDEMLGGGFEATREYLLIGLAGAGKSLSMLNLAYQFKIFNKDFKTKDPTKIPTILFLTQENTMGESVERLQEIITGKNIKTSTKEEILNTLREEGELLLSGDNPINIMIMYKPDRSIDTSDLYSIIEDLEDDGYEVICLFQDHIKRIRSVENCKDLRIELGCIANEMKTLAILKQIPVITDTHINREGARAIEDSKASSSKADLTRLLGRHNVGESMLMIDNVDAAIIINKDYDKDENPYMCFNRIKLRYGYSKLDFLYYPFDVDNQIRLMTDRHLEVPIYITTLRENSESPNFNRNGTNIKRTQYSIEQDEENEATNNLFEFRPSGTMYDMNSVKNNLNNPYDRNNKFNFIYQQSVDDKNEKFSPVVYYS